MPRRRVLFSLASQARHFLPEPHDLGFLRRVRLLHLRRGADRTKVTHAAGVAVRDAPRGGALRAARGFDWGRYSRAAK